MVDWQVLRIGICLDIPPSFLLPFVQCYVPYLVVIELTAWADWLTDFRTRGEEIFMCEVLLKWSLHVDIPMTKKLSLPINEIRWSFFFSQLSPVPTVQAELLPRGWCNSLSPSWPWFVKLLAGDIRHHLSHTSDQGSIRDGHYSLTCKFWSGGKWRGKKQENNVNLQLINSDLQTNKCWSFIR